MAMPQIPSNMQAYCPKCKTTRMMIEVQVVTTDGKPAAKGKCPVCGTTLLKFLPAGAAK